MVFPVVNSSRVNTQTWAQPRSTAPQVIKAPSKDSLAQRASTAPPATPQVAPAARPGLLGRLRASMPVRPEVALDNGAPSVARAKAGPAPASSFATAKAALPANAGSGDLLSRLRASQSALPPLAVKSGRAHADYFPQAGLSALVPPPLYSATLPADYAEAGRDFFSENAVPMNSIVLLAPAPGESSYGFQTYNDDPLSPRYIAQAALEANPEIQFIVPTQQPFASTQDPRFTQVRSELAERLGVPPDQVFPTRNTMSWFPQDEFLAGEGGLTHRRADVVGRDSDRSTRFGARELARELDLPSRTFDSAAPGGDLHFVERNGEQFAYFGRHTLADVARARGGRDQGSPEGMLQTIAVTMDSLVEAGVPVTNIMPLGQSAEGQGLTYGEVMQRLTPAQRNHITPAVRIQLNTMRDLPFPERNIDYHTDVFAFTADGQQMFVRQFDAANADLSATLDHFGFEAVPTPYGRLVNPRQPADQRPDREMQEHRAPPVFDADVSSPSSDLSINYSNMVTGRLPDGRQTLLMPTEAMDPARLTARDREVMELLQSKMPSALIVPIGGRSAVTGMPVHPLGSRNRFEDGSEIFKNWGAHCMVNVLPYVLDIADEKPGSR
jgi:hypothetical protein